MRAPMMSIHTVAAGGGSILHYDGSRYRVGPDSAGANPGPACYRRGGPLTVTDANVMLGKIQPAFFPRVFGPNGEQPLDAGVVAREFQELTKQIGDGRSGEEVAEGFVQIAVGNMANAIKHISVQRGHDVTRYTLCCFGGAAGQHACLVADALGMTRVFIHPHAGVLSAYGMGLADQTAMRERAVEMKLDDSRALQDVAEELAAAARQELVLQGVPASQVQIERRVHLKYDGTDTALIVKLAPLSKMVAEFEAAYRKQFSFLMPGRPLVAEAVSVEAIAPGDAPKEPPSDPRAPAKAAQKARMFTGGAWHETPLYRRDELAVGQVIVGPAIIAEANATTVVEPEWRALVTALDHLVLERVKKKQFDAAIGTQGGQERW